MVENLDLNRRLFVLVGDDVPEETPDDEVSEIAVVNDFSIKSLFVLYINYCKKKEKKRKILT